MEDNVENSIDIATFMDSCRVGVNKMFVDTQNSWL